MSIPIRLPIGERKITPQREENTRKKEEAPRKSEEAPRKGPSRHTRDSHSSEGSYSGWDVGGEWDAGGTWEDLPEERPKKSAKIDSREGLEQDLAMLLGGRRQKYAADMMYGEDAPWRETGPGHYSPIGGHGAQTYSEQFTEPEDASMATNAEEAALLRERDRLDPYGSPTRKMQVQDLARQRILSEYLGRRGR